jgi:Fe2+ transport system protein FeoA
MNITGDEAGCINVRPHGVFSAEEDGSRSERERRTLADLTPGRSFRVLKVTSGGEIRQRMVDMGFIRGAEGYILREALLRDPIEIKMNGALLSLRRVEATGIIVEELDA